MVATAAVPTTIVVVIASAAIAATASPIVPREFLELALLVLILVIVVVVATEVLLLLFLEHGESAGKRILLVERWLTVWTHIGRLVARIVVAGGPTTGSLIRIRLVEVSLRLFRLRWI